MLSEKELLILTHLRKNGRETLTKLSRKTGIPISTLHDKLKGQYHGIIEKYSALVNFSNLGFTCKAYIILRINKTQRPNILDFLLRQESVNSIYKINNGYDFLVEGIFRGIRDLETFIERIDERFDIRETKVYHVIEDIQREEFLNRPESLHLLQLDEAMPPWKESEAKEAGKVKQRRHDEENSEDDDK